VPIHVAAGVVGTGRGKGRVHENGLKEHFVRDQARFEKGAKFRALLHILKDVRGKGAAYGKPLAAVIQTRQAGEIAAAARIPQHGFLVIFEFFGLDAAKTSAQVRRVLYQDAVKSPVRQSRHGKGRAGYDLCRVSVKTGQDVRLRPQGQALAAQQVQPGVVLLRQRLPQEIKRGRDHLKAAPADRMV